MPNHSYKVQCAERDKEGSSGRDGKTKSQNGHWTGLCMIWAIPSGTHKTEGSEECLLENNMHQYSNYVLPPTQRSILSIEYVMMMLIMKYEAGNFSESNISSLKEMFLKISNSNSLQLTKKFSCEIGRRSVVCIYKWTNVISSIRFKWMNKYNSCFPILRLINFNFLINWIVFAAWNHFSISVQNQTY